MTSVLAIKRLLLLALFGFVLLICLQPDARQRLLLAQAQEIFTITPTFTPPDLSPLDTPTPTKDFRIAQEITHPSSEDAIAGFTPIWGYAVADSFRRYDLHIAVAGSESWQWLTSSTEAVYGDILYVLDTSQFPDGLYDLRLRVLRDDGNYTEDFLRRLAIRNTNPPTITPAVNELGTRLPTPPPTPTVPTPTATPEFISNVPDGQGIFLPYNNGVVRGMQKIIGTANGKPNATYVRYELAISPRDADDWTFLFSSSDQIWQNTLYKLDSRRFPDGRYDLRLRIVYTDGNFDEYQVRNLYIANTTPVNLPTATPTPPVRGIFEPSSGEVISGTLAITGTANMVNFHRWELAWSTSGSDDWVTLVENTVPVQRGLLARLDLSLLTPDQYDLRLRIYNWNNQFEEYVVPGLVIPAPTPTPTITPIPPPAPSG